MPRHRPRHRRGTDRGSSISILHESHRVGGWRKESTVRAGDALNTLSREALEAEILRLRATEATLRASEERFRTILETVDAAFAIVEVKFDAADQPVDYRFLEANPAFEREAGVNLRGKWVTEFAPDL